MRQTQKTIISSLLISLSIFTGLSLAQVSQAITVTTPSTINRSIPTGQSAQATKVVTKQLFNTGFKNSVSPIMTEEDDWFSTLLVFDDNGDEHNDMLSTWAFLFEDGTWQYSHNGFLEISPSDPTTITMVIDMNTGTLLSAEYVMEYADAIMVDSNYVEIGDMIPTVNEDGWGVTFTTVE